MKKALLFIGLTFILTACQLSSILQPTATPTVTPTFTPEPTNTLQPTATHTPVPTVTPTETPVMSCSADDLIEKLKQQVPYDDYTLSYNTFGGVRYLLFWIVDLNINPKATEAELATNFDLAVKDSIELAHKLNQAELCTAQLFDAINPVVVDANHNGWFSGLIDIKDLPSSAELTEGDISTIKDSILAKGVWQRQTVTDIQNIPSSSCSWSEVLEKVSRHFFEAPLNAYILVADNNGITFTVQFQGNGVGDEAVVFLNTGREVSCLQPSVDMILVILVDKNGNVNSTKRFPMKP